MCKTPRPMQGWVCCSGRWPTTCDPHARVGSSEGPTSSTSTHSTHIDCGKPQISHVERDRDQTNELQIKLETEATLKADPIARVEETDKKGSAETRSMYHLVRSDLHVLQQAQNKTPQPSSETSRAICFTLAATRASPQAKNETKR